MEPKPDPPRAPMGAGPLKDLPVRGADAVDAVIGVIRDKAVRPLTLATRAIVFGIVVLAASVVTTALLSITLIRLLTVYLFGGRVWISDVVVGALFVVVGLVLWSRRVDTATGSEGAS